ncbi:LacI family DNA-binding transcriptional regulator [Deinococcus hohokamensis]|uniref:LacI family DNA-binding transcriptional regulator n=1 Tax=Deinococcus hohokamensis TaxID=309883 RepID=A0ABV9IDS3_9DEIO
MATPTLEDVAQAAGVSVSTASRVFTGTAKVRSDKHAAVMRAAEELGYRPNAIARSLASGRSLLIGVLTQDISSPFYGEVLRGIEQGLEGSSYSAIFASGHWRVEEEASALHGLMGRPVDGLIVLGGHTPDERLAAMAAKVPLIAVGRNIQGLEGQCLRIDNVQGSYDCARHLLELGHRRIAYIAGPESHRDARERLQGFQRALADWNVEANPSLIVEGDFLEPSGLLAVEALFARGAMFSAVMAANDQMAYGARLGLYRRGIRVPEDISLVGFDDLSGSAFTTPPLTTMRQPTYEMGVTAAEAILAALSGTPLPAAEFRVQLMVRESTAPTHRERQRLSPLDSRSAAPAAPPTAQASDPWPQDPPYSGERL